MCYCMAWDKWNREKELKKNKIKVLPASPSIFSFSHPSVHMQIYILETHFKQHMAKEYCYEHVYIPYPLKKVPFYSTKMNIGLDFSSQLTKY